MLREKSLKTNVFNFLVRLNKELDDFYGRVLSQWPLLLVLKVLSKMQREEHFQKVINNTYDKLGLKVGSDGSFHGLRYGYGWGLFNRNGHIERNQNGLEIKLGYVMPTKLK